MDWVSLIIVIIIAMVLYEKLDDINDTLIEIRDLLEPPDIGQRAEIFNDQSCTSGSAPLLLPVPTESSSSMMHKLSSMVSGCPSA